MRSLLSGAVRLGVRSVRPAAELGLQLAVIPPVLGVGVGLAGVRLTSSVVRKAVGGAVPLVVVDGEPRLPSRLSPARIAPAAGLVLAQAPSVIDPREGRRRRRIRVRGAGQGQTELDRVTVEVRGLTGPDGAALCRLLAELLREGGGYAWFRVNTVTGRLTVAVDPARRSVSDVCAVVLEAERLAGTTGAVWSSHADLPGDREPVLAAALGLAADAIGAGFALATWGLPVPAGVRGMTAVMALVDNQPRIRRVVESRLGPPRTDLVITVGNAVAHALGHGAAALVVDGGQRLVTLLEMRASRTSWDRWDDELGGEAGVSVTDPLQMSERPAPMPAGILEVFADRAATGSLLAGGSALVGRRSVTDAADALLIGVPKASRTCREAFAGVLSASLSHRGALSLDSSVWRRLDRVDVVVIDVSVLHGGPALVLDAVSTHPSWTVEQVWSAGQRLLRRTVTDTTGAHAAGAETVGADPAGAAPAGVNSGHLALAGSPDTSGVPGWMGLQQGSRLVGRVLVGSELHPGADELIAAARRAGLRVVLAGSGHAGELRGRADENVAASVSILATVRRLQTDGSVVAVVSGHAHRALAAADVGLGVARRGPAGAAVTARTSNEQVDGAVAHVPWSADVVCPDLAVVQQVLAATAHARAVSQRGRTLAMSASALGALLMVAGPRAGVWRRSVSPVTGAAAAGLVSGVLAGRRAARPVVTPTVPLVPWHNLEADEVLLRLDPPAPTDAVDPSLPLTGFLPLICTGAAGRTASLLHHVRAELADPLTPVLTVGAAASAILGAPTDAALVASVMGVNALVSALQRQRADQAMQSLNHDERVPATRLQGAVARTVGALQPAHLPALERVPTSADTVRPGEVIALAAGDVVPVDGRLLEVDDLEVDESGLTGESVTVDKRVGATPGAGLSERSCMVYEGSVVVAGRGRAVVVAVGDATQAGRARRGHRSPFGCQRGAGPAEVAHRQSTAPDPGWRGAGQPAGLGARAAAARRGLRRRRRGGRRGSRGSAAGGHGRSAGCCPSALAAGCAGAFQPHGGGAGPSRHVVL